MRKKLRSDTVTQGRLMAGARSLWRANGMKEEHFGKPVIAVVNSFTEMVPGHRHLNEAGKLVKDEILKQGCFAPEFNTIALDDGIAMGHNGMLYSLPSREVIADSIEYMCNAHCIDAMICISNCDKITPGMMMAAMRLNIPAVFISGGPMEAGRSGDDVYDLVDVMVSAGDNSTSDSKLLEMEKSACPGCGSCAGMFTANSMNCLAEAIGLALPGNGTIVATHSNRTGLFRDAANLIVRNTLEYYRDGNEKVLPRNIAKREAFLNAMKVDIAMGGSTNTVLHLLAIANEGNVDFSMKDVDELSKRVPTLCKVSPSSHYRMEDVNRAGGIVALMAELDKGSLLDKSVNRIDHLHLDQLIRSYDITNLDVSREANKVYSSAPGGVGKSFHFGAQSNTYSDLDKDRTNGCIRDIDNAYSHDGGLAVLYGNLAPDGCIVKTAGVKQSLLRFEGRAVIFESQDDACKAILGNEVMEGDVIIIRYEGPRGGPGMQEMLYPTSYLKSAGLDDKCALITDGRFSGGTTGLSIGHVSPEAAAGGNLAVIKDNDSIKIDIPSRQINVELDDKELEERHRMEKAQGNNNYKPRNREREVSMALKLYARNVSSADRGAIRTLD